MIDLGFQLVTIGSDQRYMSAGAKSSVSKLKNIKSKEESKALCTKGLIKQPQRTY